MAAGPTLVVQLMREQLVTGRQSCLHQSSRLEAHFTAVAIATTFVADLEAVQAKTEMSTPVKAKLEMQ